MTSADELDRLHEESLEVPLTCYRCFKLRWDWYRGNPFAKGRFALVPGQPVGVIAREAFYFAWTADAAIWETLLRDLVADANGMVHLPVDWKEWGLARIDLHSTLSIVALDQPARRNSIDHSTSKDRRWDGHLSAPTYVRTHVAAAAVDAQFRAAGKHLSAFRWPSHQVSTDLAAVQYGPDPNAQGYTPPQWTQKTWSLYSLCRLDSEEGLQALKQAVARAGWIIAPDLLDGIIPPPAGKPL